MPREGPERRRDRPEYDPNQDSMLRKVARVEFGNPLVDAMIRAALVVALGGGGSYVASESKNAELEALKAKVLALEAAQDARWTRYYERRGRERETAQREHLIFERRFVRLESRAGLEAPPGAAPVEIGAPERADR